MAGGDEVHAIARMKGPGHHVVSSALLRGRSRGIQARVIPSGAALEESPERCRRMVGVWIVTRLRMIAQPSATGCWCADITMVYVCNSRSSYTALAGKVL